jgi:hypothetical protein
MREDEPYLRGHAASEGPRSTSGPGRPSDFDLSNTKGRRKWNTGLMPSLALETFQSSCKDVDRLLEIHGDVSGDAPGRKYGVEVLNKASYVLLSAFWEAFCEDVAGEALDRLVDEAPDSTYLPTDLKRLIAQELQDDPHQLATWQLADAGWRDVLVLRLEKLRAERNRSLNTPNAANIDAFLERALGIKQISALPAFQWVPLALIDPVAAESGHARYRVVSTGLGTSGTLGGEPGRALR